MTNNRLSDYKEAIKRNEDYRWEVYSSIYGSTVILSIICGVRTLSNTDICVNPPNWFERQLGITHKLKIEKATHRQKERCRRLNEDDAKARDLEPWVNKILTDCEVK